MGHALGHTHSGGSVLSRNRAIYPRSTAVKLWLGISPIPRTKQVAVLPLSVADGDAQTAASGRPY